jgi:hypothetical protein
LKTSACSSTTPRPIAANGSSMPRSRRGDGCPVGVLLRQDGPECGIEKQAEAAEPEEHDQSDADRQQRDTQMLRQAGGDTGDDPVLARPDEPAGGWCGRRW